MDTERAFQVVETFSRLIHEQQRAGIMVTHDLRMTKYVDRVIHMVDGKVESILDDPAQFEVLARTSSFEAALAYPAGELAEMWALPAREEEPVLG